MKITRLPSNLEKRKKNVAAYARVSTLFEEQEDSFETQCNYYTQYIQSVPDWNFVGVYADHGKSGLSADKRPEFLRMIEDCKAHKIDIILCKSISRFGRNATEILDYIHILKECETEVRYERESISSNDPSTEMVLHFMAAVSEEESRSISDNVKWSLAKNAEKGIRHIGNNRVIGFDEIDGKLTPNADAWIPELIFTEYAAGKSPTEISRLLADKGAERMRAKGKPFSIPAIFSVLKNEMYMGDRIIQKTPSVNLKTKRVDWNAAYKSVYVENDHDPIISKEVWQQAQDRIKREAEERKKNINRTHASHFMYGKLFCGECGEPLTRRTIYYKGVMQKVWKCKTRIKGGGEMACSNDVISEEELFKSICQQTGTPWHGIDKITEETFENIESVYVHNGRRVEINMAA